MSMNTEHSRPFVVCTSGEPLLQLDKPLIDALHEVGFEITIETNGTQPAPPGIDWICVSLKAGAEFVLSAADELKVILPQQGADPLGSENLDFQHFFLRPMEADADDGEHHFAPIPIPNRRDHDGPL